ncbi:hypothetical protein PG984_016222 [Apiospora sp. TS-2023a]
MSTSSVPSSPSARSEPSVSSASDAPLFSEAPPQPSGAPPQSPGAPPQPSDDLSCRSPDSCIPCWKTALSASLSTAVSRCSASVHRDRRGQGIDVRGYAPKVATRRPLCHERHFKDTPDLKRMREAFKSGVKLARRGQEEALGRSPKVVAALLATMGQKRERGDLRRNEQSNAEAQAAVATTQSKAATTAWR